MAKAKKLKVEGEVQAKAPIREPAVESTHEEIVAGVPELALAGGIPAEPDPLAKEDKAPTIEESTVFLTVTVPKQEFAALMYAMVTGMASGWLRQAAVTRIGTMLGGKTHQERMEIWEDMKQTHLNKPGNQ
jgi:hypothetical protein